VLPGVGGAPPTPQSFGSALLALVREVAHGPEWKEESMRKLDVALWRYQIIAPLISLSGPRGTLKKEIEKIAARTYEHPIRGAVRPAYGTIEEWYYRYKKNGLEALEDRPRKDRGRSRRIGPQLAEAIEDLALARPELDGPGILAELDEAALGELPSFSTLYRFLKARGLDQRAAPRRRDHRAFSFDLAGDCWQADVMYGPSIPYRDGSRRKTYLMAILDDATRLICHGQFYFDQNLPSFKDSLKQALLKRGLPRRLYVDNGKIFRSRLVLQIAARLGVQIIHSRPYRPQGRAKLERWFGTVRKSFLARVDVDRLRGIEHLNRLLFAWIEGQYHTRPHRGLDGQTPFDRWVRLSEQIRPLPPELDIEELFLEETSRRVAKDGTFALKGKRFEAGPHFVGQRIRVLFDPFDLRKVVIPYGEDKRREAFPVDLAANRHVARRADPDRGPRRTPPTLRAMERLARRIDQQRSGETDHD